MDNTFSIDLLYAALDEKREASGLTWAGVGREFEQQLTKVSPGTISGIRSKQFVEGDGVLQMLLWLDRAPESFVPGFDCGPEHQLTRPGKGVLRFDVTEIYRQIEPRKRANHLSWADVAEQIGDVPVSVLQRYKAGGRTSFPLVVRIARWLRQPVKAFTVTSPF